jgi:hypothetical protein
MPGAGGIAVPEGREATGVHLLERIDQRINV